MIRELFKDIGKYLPAQIAPALVGFLSIPIITRLFPPENYGNYVLVLATVSILTIITGWLPMSIIRFYPAYLKNNKLKEFYGTVIKSTFISVVILTFIFFSILIIIKDYLPEQLFPLMRIGIFIFILQGCFQSLQHFLRAKRQVSWYSGFAIWKSITGIGFGLFLVIAFHLDIKGLLWGSILSLAIILPFLWKRSIGDASLRSNISIPMVSEMAKYSFPLVIANLAAWILSLSDRYVLGIFRSSQEVGIYSASYNISEHSIMLIAALFMLSSGPISIHIWEKEGKEKSKEFVSKLTRYYLILCIPAVVGLSVLAKPVINIMTEQQYFGGYKIIPFVTLGAFFLGLQQRFQTGFVFYKKTVFITVSIVTSGVLNLGLNFLLIPKYGYMAAAFTTLISYTFLLALMIFVSRKFFVWEFPFRTLIKVCGASAVMGVVVYTIGNSLTSSISINLIVGICIGAVVYITLLFLLQEPKAEEIRELCNFKNKIFKRILK